MVRRLSYISIILAVLVAFFVWGDRTIEINVRDSVEAQAVDIQQVLERADGDIPNQKQLENPPEEVRAVYITNWVAGTPSIFNNVMNSIRDTRVNAVIVDIKDYSGFVGYNSDLKIIEEYKSKELRIKKLNQLIKTLHDEGYYIIGRVSVFQDPRLALARPDIAVKDSEGNVWEDRHGLSWVDPASTDVWDYNVEIAQELHDRGIDEVNFDYIRFPTDGAGINSLQYPIWNSTEAKHNTIRSFFAYLDQELEDVTISGDIFGQTTINSDDLGIGQLIEDAYDYFDYIAPMVYPSHFINGFIGLDNPGAHPYEVIKYSMDTAQQKLEWHERKTAQGTATTTPPITLKQIKRVKTKLRPWLQDFDLGAKYTVEMVQDQMQATVDSGLDDSWMIWNPSNKYRRAIFEIKEPEAIEVIEQING